MFAYENAIYIDGMPLPFPISINIPIPVARAHLSLLTWVEKNCDNGSVPNISKKSLDPLIAYP
jgi:hypothetical protein